MRVRTKIGRRWYIEERRLHGRVVQRIEVPGANRLADVQHFLDAGSWTSRGPDGKGRRRPRERPDSTVHIIGVTTYRLATLVILPAWSPVAGGWKGEMNTSFEGNVISTPDGDVFHESVNASVMQSEEHADRWIAWCEGQDPPELKSDCASRMAAMAACEARLRELGYRVAKPKAGT